MVSSAEAKGKMVAGHGFEKVGVRTAAGWGDQAHNRTEGQLCRGFFDGSVLRADDLSLDLGI